MTGQPAPEFPDDLHWLELSEPLRFDGALRGQCVLVWFWCSAGVHATHTVPELAWLEQRFADHPFVVIGVHSAKYAAETPDHVAQTVERLGIRHPTVLDPDRRAWALWGAQAWPTVALVDTQGAIRFLGAGEPDRLRLERAIEFVLEEAGPAARRLPYSVRSPGMGPARRPATDLRFPAGVAWDDATEMLWIADSGRHRVLGVRVEPAAASGELRHTAGVGHAGMSDGDFGYASFCSPRGLCMQLGRLLVADAGNHLVRIIDADGAGVDTLVGTGRLELDMAGGMSGMSQGIASPWDVDSGDDGVMVAMAGVHQLWSVSPDDGFAASFAGDGTLGWRDGDRHMALLFQPAAVATLGEKTAFVDSESNAVRICDSQRNSVETLVGGEAFAAGNAIGSFAETVLQQPRGIAWIDAGHLLVADTFNDRVVRLDLAAREADVLLDPGQVRRPEGICVHDGVLWVADTGNHRVLRVDLESGDSQALQIKDPHPEHEEMGLPPIQAKADAAVTFCFPLMVPSGEHIHPDVRPWAVALPLEGSAPVTEFDAVLDVQGEWVVFRDVPVGAAGSGRMRLEVRYVTCAEYDGVAHPQCLATEVDVEVTADGPTTVDLPIAP